MLPNVVVGPPHHEMNDGFVTHWEIAMTSVGQVLALAGELKLGSSLV